ncbi:MAG: alanine racemase [Acidimicrobiales bacterium]
MRIHELPTPALVIDVDLLDHNIDTMATVRPGRSLRSHVKAHKCTELARHLAERAGSDTFCCATVREMSGMIAAGLGTDLLLANQSVDVARLSALAAQAGEADARVTIAIDSPETLAAAVAARRSGPLDVLVDVNVGMPRCGVTPDGAGALADAARAAGLEVRGVMGYEGHVVGNDDRAWRVEQVELAMARLRTAHYAVGGDITSAGATGTWDLHSWAGEVQAGSYLLMDTFYARLDLPFRQALSVVATVVSVNRADSYAVADAGLKAFGMDHGEPTVVGHSMFMSADEHAIFLPAPGSDLAVGDRITMWPAHIDPTMALHERAYVVRGDEVIDAWPIDLRNW